MGFTARFCALALLTGTAQALVACQTSGAGAESKAATSDELAITDGEAPTHVPPPATEPAAGKAPAAAAPSRRGVKGTAAIPTSAKAAALDDEPNTYVLGPLRDEDIQDAAYEGLKMTIGSHKSMGGGDEEKTELGDGTKFNYSIVKLLKGKDDISGDGGPADGMDVEVTGWYKRSVINKTEHSPEPACTSFDALVAISKQGDAWHLTPGETPTFGREDSEDCF